MVRGYPGRVRALMGLLLCIGVCMAWLLAGAWAAAPAARSLAADNPNPPAAPVRLVFIHHSVGDAWLAEGDGGLGDALGANNYYVSDTYYDWGPDDIGSYTDIGDWWTWFRGPDSARYMQAVYTTSNQHASYTRPMSPPAGENTIVLFKSCYFNAHLGGSPDDPPTTGENPLRGEDYSSEHHTVGNAKGIYNDLLAYFSTRQDKLFVLITTPPRTSNETDASHAANARALSDWLVNDWLDGYPYSNVAVFDLYNVLTSNGGSPAQNDLGAESGNHHRWRQGAVQHTHPVENNYAAYGSNGDSHPTPAGNQKATGEFVQLLNVFYHRWQSGATEPTPTLTATRVTPSATATATRVTPAWSGALRLPLILKGRAPVHTPTPTQTAKPQITPTHTPRPTDAGCPAYAPGRTFVTGQGVYAMPVLAEPAPRQWFSDPTFGACLVRVTDRDHDLDPEDGSPGITHEYARVQAFNADESRLLARSTDGYWYLYDAQTLLPLKRLPLDREPCWDAQDPRIVYHTSDTSLLSYNVQTDQEAELHDFASNLPGQSIAAVWTR
ncbi:MAG: hypothetical protein FJZ90_14910, partial [Chloroflexi bacterium]|nr:hypothetical protein [Chloroflexota bacterium]